MSKEEFMCPRREEVGGASHFPGPDTWRKGGGLVNQARGCSYCGSMNPDDFMEALREGMVLSPTDKSYKAYLSQPMSDDEIKERDDKNVETWMKKASMTLEQAQEYVKNVYGCHNTKRDIGKFYFMHLSDGQKQEFIDMLNAKTMKIGYPGRIYTRPYFIAP